MGRILLLIALSPVLLFGFVFAGVASIFWAVFPRRPASAQDMLDGLTDLLAVRDDDSWNLDDALGNVVARKYSDPEVEAIRLRLKLLPDFPWDQATIDEISAMRESARVLVSRREP